MMRSFKYRLHPNAAQTCVLEDWLGKCCALYNAALEQRDTYWRQARKSISYYEQAKQLTELRADDPAFDVPPALVLRSALQRIDRAFMDFFRRCRSGEKPGYPRFRSWRRYDSFDTGCVKVTKDRLHVPKLGHVKMNLYRPIEGTIKNATIRRDYAGKWWVSIQCDLGPAPEKCEIKSSVGIDLGLIVLAMRSDGVAIQNHRYGKQSAEKLARQQRVLARKLKGSQNREAARILAAKTYAHIANQRLDQARKEAKKLFTEFDEVAYEDLSVQRLCRGRYSKSMHDASWGVFLRCCASKAEEAGKHHTPKDHRKTSQRCSSCGQIVKMTIADRVFRCRSCGLEIDRDHNAAINIRSARPGRSGADQGRTRHKRAGPVGDEGKVADATEPRKSLSRPA
jgi:putative transposase